MNKIFLSFLACPALVMSALLSFTVPTPANPASAPTPKPTVSSPTPQCPDLSDRLEFTDEESDAAIARFGYDCLPCITALRQLRSLPPAS